ncbi:unnamed protein product [Gongylonema pulchrum]|uniref:Ovule protein n=1 Tax=Gongylonema pulchrum TaxID=637853 RepID=A0A183D8L2_9BILA|nr:unnamed protein product [Gongylonema pulchrum]
MQEAVAAAAFGYSSEEFFPFWHVKSNDADDVETAQSSHQLTEDKKDVALETELETRTPSSSLIGLNFHIHPSPGPPVHRSLFILPPPPPATRAGAISLAQIHKSTSPVQQHRHRLFCLLPKAKLHHCLLCTKKNITSIPYFSSNG